MKKSRLVILSFLVIGIEGIALIGFFSGPDLLKHIHTAYPYLGCAITNLVFGILIGIPKKKKKTGEEPRPSPKPKPRSKRASLSKSRFTRDYDVPGPGWKTGWKLFPPCSIFSLIQHFHIFLHLQISFVLGNYFLNLLLHLFFFG